REYCRVFRQSGNRYMAERANDVQDIEKLLLAELLGRRQIDLSKLDSPIVLLAHGLTPSETTKLDRDKVLGFVTETGGAGGHVAIVAEALEIPAVVGLGDFLGDIKWGDTVIVDGNLGRLVIQPDEETLAAYEKQSLARDQRVVELSCLREMPAETVDGERIQLLANIEFPREASRSLDRGAEGIGLYRTEFLYIGTTEEPSEDEQYAAYKQVAESVEGRPVVVRTLDLGADKLAATIDHHEERNPFLGLRSIRLSLRYPDMFRRQLRAILRASVHGSLRLMFPLISTLVEWNSARAVLDEIRDELRANHIPFDENIPVGMMVEVPSTIIMLDRFLDDVDFISIGTNDLVQYALGVDRSNKDVAGLYSNADPAVLRLIEMAVGAASQKNVPVSLCGQMSANPMYTMLLLGLGLRTLSVPPVAIPEIKKVCRSVTLDDCRRVARGAMERESALEIRTFLKEELRKSAPEFAPQA
ncbi:MAG: phosphoenolpyruvate--protein phosphotransferase, partial [Planctomycetota bacterium]